MNGIPMKLDYSKTLNEQLDTFEYYKNRYCSYELELTEDRKEINRLNNIIDGLEKYLKENIELTKKAVHFEILYDYDTRKYKRDIALFEWILDKLNKLKGDNK